jgi:hypothetical protein
MCNAIVALATVVTIALLTGCRHAKTSTLVSVLPVAALSEDAQIIVFAGQFEKDSSEDGLGIARYKMHVLQPRVTINSTMDIVYYPGSRSNRLPHRALIIMKRRNDGSLELLGLDADRSILTDTPDARRSLMTIPKRSNMSQPRLSREAAVGVAKSATLRNVATAQLHATTSRYEFGWIVAIRSSPNAPVGGEVYVVVGDDGKVKHISGGM